MTTKTNTARKPRAPRASRKPVPVAAPADIAPVLETAVDKAVEVLAQKAEALQPVTEAIDEQEGYLVRKGSVVRKAYKQAYKAGGDSRGNKDWLFTLLKGATLDANGKADIDALVAIADENGVPSHYTNRSAGWQGRMRMTIGLRLRSAVAKRGFLVLGGEQVPAPEAFCQAWRGNTKAAEVAKEEEAGA